MDGLKKAVAGWVPEGYGNSWTRTFVEGELLLGAVRILPVMVIYGYHIMRENFQMVHMDVNWRASMPIDIHGFFGISERIHKMLVDMQDFH